MWGKPVRLFVLFLAVGCQYATHARAESQHAFSVIDSVEMARFNMPSENPPTDAPSFSPDRSAFIVMTTKGIPETNENESSLWLYRTEQVRQFLDHGGQAPIARRLAAVRAEPRLDTPTNHGPIVTKMRWSPDSRSLYFIKETTHGTWQLARIRVSDGMAEDLTLPSENVRAYAFSGSTVAYLRAATTKQEFGPADSAGSKESFVPMSIRGRTIESLVLANDPSQPVMAQLCELRGGKRLLLGKPYIEAGFGGAYSLDTMAMSPDGLTIVRSRPMEEIPSSWRNYEPMDTFESFRIDPANPDLNTPYNFFRARQYVLDDVKSGRERPLIDAPTEFPLGYSDEPIATWSKDGRRALLTATFLSASGDTAENSGEHFKHPCAAVVFELASGQVSCLAISRWSMVEQQTAKEALLLDSAVLDDAGTSVTLTYVFVDRKSIVDRYELRAGQWTRVSHLVGDEAEAVLQKKQDALRVSVKQAIDHHPVLWAADDVRPDGAMLWDPNPGLASMSMGQASVFHWKDASGYEWSGGLIKPVGYIPGKRYPLVIQTHGFLKYKFLTDGFYPTGVAAQPLANAGFVVVQMDTRHTHYVTPQEVLDQITGIDSLLDALDKQGLIDLQHVGIAGFSRTCWYVLSSLEKDPHRFAAATIADGADEGYMQYRLFGDAPYVRNDAEAIHGGPLRSSNLAGWTQHATPFFSDRIQTPLLIQTIGARSILMEWEIYDSLYQQGKPVDLLYFPYGQHVMQRPRDLIGSEQSVVDWFRFWLQGYERPEAEAKAQFARWERIRSGDHASRDPVTAR